MNLLQTTTYQKLPLSAGLIKQLLKDIFEIAAGKPINKICRVNKYFTYL